ncbi:MAG TPA: HD domain-containing phosphohydrolase [Candidatus Saccharicenans sp.]|nr:HD domain-containing phosphohydrolase [Candidatus Saccharicenans sp.]
MYTDKINAGTDLNNNHQNNQNSRLKVLITDADQKYRQRLFDYLQSLKVEVETSPDLPPPSQADKWLKNTILIVSPQPDKADKINQLRLLKSAGRDLTIIMLTSSLTANHYLTYLQAGLIDYVCSRHNLASVFSAVRAEISRRQLKHDNEIYLKNLTRLKLEHSRHIRKRLELEEIYDTTVENLMTALDLRDVETFGHSQTVSKYCQVLARLLGINQAARLDNIRKGSLLHDIGKIAIPDSILKKPGQLTSDEWAKIKLHPTLGFGLIKEMKMLAEVGHIILYHHEKYDGSGYPRGLKGEEIPLESRIFALADTLDAITSHRPYRAERDFHTAREEIIKNAGSHFDPQVVEAFCSLDIEKWERIRYETTRLIPSFEEYQPLLKNKN